jgi:microcystin-dependent protein
VTDPFIGEIRAFGFPYAPPGWAFCNGQLLTIADNSTLYSLLGTHYGGNGQTTFGLPDLRGKVPMSWGQGPGLSPRSIGESAGADAVTLTVGEMPSHAHAFNASIDLADERQPPGQAFAQGDGTSAFGALESPTQMFNFGVAVAGQNQAHNNLMPFLTLSFCIALKGDWPGES